MEDLSKKIEEVTEELKSLKEKQEIFLTERFCSQIIKNLESIKLVRFANQSWLTDKLKDIHEETEHILISFSKNQIHKKY